MAVVAPAGEAHPGWLELPSGAAIDVGALRISSTDAGELRVGSGADAVARAPPADPDRLDDGELRAIAAEALAAMRGEPVAAGGTNASERSRRRVAAVVGAIADAVPSRP